MKKLRIIDRAPREEYSQTLSLQEQLLAAKVDDRSLADMLVLVEHQPVYTTGRSVEFQKPAVGAAADVPWVEVGRGGQATYHGPGQLVAYPVFDLAEHGKDVHVYLRKLERSIILCLKKFGLQGSTREGLTGVWVEDANQEWKKIASIGIGVRKWVSYHGLALNVSTDLEYFKSISACGQSGETMISLEELFSSEFRRVPPLDEVKSALVDAFVRVFRMELEEKVSIQKPKRRPNWLKAKAPGSPTYIETQEIVSDLELNTVCQEARCPNVGECWSHNTATFMIMGDHCTRRCGFCSVMDGTLHNLEPLNPMEPLRVGAAIAKLGLKHVVITSVNRDDLQDMGSEHFHQTVKAIKQQNPDCDVELLIPDLQGRRELLETILKSSQVRVLNHNLETVPRLYRRVRPGAELERSLNVLRWSREIQPDVLTKSGIMVGLGETRSEVLELMDLLRKADCNIMTIGQYLQPTPQQLPVERFVTPEEFEDYKQEGIKRGFSHIESGPLVRSSYHAWEHTGASKGDGRQATGDSNVSKDSLRSTVDGIEPVGENKLADARRPTPDA